MDIFKLQQNIVEQYKNYIESFINIDDERIREKIDEELKGGKLTPDPLIQFNPSFEQGTSMDELCNGLLHPEMGNIFKGFQMYKHQIEAIKLGISGKDFIVTSGTGSGKSLTYIGTIFNQLLSNTAKRKGIKAIIVYPMNALINSQTEEFRKYRDNYEKNFGKGTFPITFEQYTGQEKEDARERIKNNPPDILLTNYMMLELMMTRPKEADLRKNIKENLDFLVFDELHTYRGRQGADVAILIRRIQSLTDNKDLRCIGTSATMVSGDILLEQQTKVAEVATTFFSKKFEPNQVVNEYLERKTIFNGVLPNAILLQEALNKKINQEADEDNLKQNALAIWVENSIALNEVGGWLKRGKPLTFVEIIEKLHQDSDGFDKAKCEIQLKNLLAWAENINNQIREKKERYSYLAYRLHQFISQSGNVYVSLDAANLRSIQLEPGYFIQDGKNKSKPIFPVVFSRFTGREFICVRCNSAENRLEQREFSEILLDDDEKETIDVGYIILDKEGEEPIWGDSVEFLEFLPDSWIKVKKSGISIDAKYAKRIPQKIYFNNTGFYSKTKTDETDQEAWFMSAKLLFDPTGMVFFDPKTSEGTKLMRLGNEGRSTATTIFSYETIRELYETKIETSKQKILSFTDNRQDAALQSGHFNDFIKVGQLRSAIYHALKTAPKDEGLDFETLPMALFKSINIPYEDYAKSTSEGAARRDDERAFRNYLMLRAVQDLRRGWRFNMPNLEAAGILHIRYKYIDELVDNTNAWSHIPLLEAFDKNKRLSFFEDVLDFFRTSFAIEYEPLEDRDRLRTQLRSKLKEPWTLGEEEKINEPFFIRITQLDERTRNRYFTTSGGKLSALGKYIRNVAKDNNVQVIDREQLIEDLFDLLERQGYLRSTTITSNNEPIKLYRLRLDLIAWTLGDLKTARTDNVRFMAKKMTISKANSFFKKYYMQNFSELSNLSSREHTGQVKNEDRQEREELFRAGKIGALYCSPTMELGIDISDLSVVHMRNVPPNPANYAQRSGRAGRSGQGALVFTYCASGSPHDRHYFTHKEQMVAGAVAAPQLDLCNEELLRSHINAIYLSMVGLNLEKSIADILEIEKKNQPIRAEVHEKFTADHQVRTLLVKAQVKSIIETFKEDLKQTYWFNEAWLNNEINTVYKKFGVALDRWRKLYQNAIIQLDGATLIIGNPMYDRGHSDYISAKRNEVQARKRLDLYKNITIGSSQLSEFYPYRYLASEGFLPGYNFTRLPLRVLVGKTEKDGEYISRQRFVGLKEFGPRNILYHNGQKYQVDRMFVNEAESKLTKAKISMNAGYFFMDEQYSQSVCPISGSELSKEGENVRILLDLVEMTEVHARPNDNISCEEEERTSQGFDIQTYFSIQGGIERTDKMLIKVDGEELLKIFFIPTAKLVQVNHKWRRAKNENGEGFLMGMQSGYWKKQADLQENNDNKEDIKLVKLYTDYTADALYIQPCKALGIEKEGIVTLQYALLRAIEQIFQVESREITAVTMGENEFKNIMIYEASEGSIGILTQLVKEKEAFKKVIRKAYEICYFENGNDTREDLPQATYQDLLSYYNQRDHRIINRHSIKNALELLLSAEVELPGKRFDDYEQQYQILQTNRDQNAPTEDVFLKYLYVNGLRLPDEAQPRMSETDNLYIQPDFKYQPHTLVFCDGRHHDLPAQIGNDKMKRDALNDAGYRVIVWHYKQKLEDFVKNYPDVFTKVK
jgi:superfamily II DNA/RNA helicase